jgi:hypothetical protein
MFNQMINMMFMSFFRMFKSLNQLMGVLDEATAAAEEEAHGWRQTLEHDRARRHDLRTAERAAALDLRAKATP